MKYVGPIGKIVLALGCALSLLVATADDAEIAALDPLHPATLLALVITRVHAVQADVRDLRASDLLAAATAEFRELIRRVSQMGADPP